MRVDALIVIFFTFCGLSLVTAATDLLVNPASTVVSESLTLYYATLDGVKDLAFTADYGKREAIVLKRDSNGMYNLFSAILLRNTSGATITNGEWFGSIFETGIELFRVDQNGQYYNYSIIENKDSYFFAKLLEDNSLMMAFPSYILTLEYDNSKWVVTNNSTFPDANFFVNSIFSAAVQSNALVVFNNKLNGNGYTYNIYVITRQLDKSWKIIETVTVADTYLSTAYSFYWDGSNTLLASVLNSDTTPYGTVLVFNKINGAWMVSQQFSAASVGVTQLGYFGVGPLVALDNNNVLVAAPYDGVIGPDSVVGAGSVFLMQRNDKNEWSFVGRFKSSASLVGSGIAKNDQDILLLGCTINDVGASCKLYTLSMCIISPIDVTCPQTRDSCDVDLDNLVPVNNPQCGQITSRYNHITTDKNTITMDVTLSKMFAPDVNCSLILTCSELYPTTPTESPVQIPIANVVTTPTENTVSSGQVLVNSVALIVAVTAFVLI